MRHLDSAGERVTTLKDKDAGCSDEIKRLQQNILRLQQQQIDIQSHAEDLEKHSRRNNIRIGGIPTAAEGSDLGEYIGAIFCYILGGLADIEMKLERLHASAFRNLQKAPHGHFSLCA
ncbi:hypothetical protein NDU88_001155 [Pleurodeles waltl]|uniref:Uncharacterized protein n=1 Tax=Pleurodeles waltl TaxID=8319 RepID=A0AAV7Q2V5_PLEWA|nr:hypothetical protein NDU88_001155 [Pleurodeles waltl]